MQDKHEQEKREDSSPLGSKAVSRREFLKIAGVAGAAVGMSAGLGGILAACGTSEETTTTGATTATTAAGVTTTAGVESSTTSVSVAAEPLKIGFISPRTGGPSSLSECDPYVLDLARTALAGGITVGDKKYEVQILDVDSGGEPAGSSEQAQKLIAQDKVDILLATTTPETTNPAADQAEAAGVPCVSTTCPWGAWYYGRGAKEGEPSPFKFTFLFSFGMNEMGMSHVAAWDQVTTNKKIGGLWPNDADGEEHRRMIPFFEESGYTVVDGGPYQNGTNDFSAQIAKFKSEGCEITTAVPIPPDAATFLRQAAQQGFKPKVVQFQKTGHQLAVVEGLGALGENLLTGFYWAPNWPYSSSLTGISNKDLSAGWTQSSGKPYQSQLGSSLALLDVGVAALKASGNPKDKVAVAEAMKTLSVDTPLGKLEWGKGPVAGVVAAPFTNGQWIKGTKFAYEWVCVENKQKPEIPVEAKPMPRV